MKKRFRYQEFTGTVQELDCLVKQNLVGGWDSKVKRVADFGGGQRLYKLKLKRHRVEIDHFSQSVQL